MPLIKKYLEDNTLTLNGVNVMKGNLKMGDREIINFKNLENYSDLNNAINLFDVVKLIRYLTSVIYNENYMFLGPSLISKNIPLSYRMNSFIHNNEKEFKFDPNIISPLATVIPGDNKKLRIESTGKYKIVYGDMFKNKGKVKFETSRVFGGNVEQTIYSDEIDFSSWTPYIINIYIYLDRNVTALKISATDSLLLRGSESNSRYFGLFLVTDILNKREAANTYLKLDGSKPMSGDLDLGSKNILKVENLTDYKDTDPYDYRVKDVKSVVNREYLNEKFMKKVDKDGREYYDLKGNIIRNCEPYYDDLFSDNDLVSKAFVQTEIAKLPKPATDVLKLDGSRGMTGDLNMNNSLITNCGRLTMVADGNSPINMSNSYLYGLPDPVSNDDATTKSYVDNRDNLNLPLNGSRAMQGNLNMNDHTITGIRSSSADNAALTVGGAKATFFPLHGNRSMQGNLNMANHSLINLKDPQPSDSSYAASVNFVNRTVNDSNLIINGVIDKKIKESEERAIRAVQQENVFEKVMVDDLFILEDDDIHKVAVVDKDFHKVNQQTYQFKIDYDSEIGYYSTRLSVNVVYLPIGYYTIVFEMYFSDKIDHDKITINSSSGTLSVSKINTKLSSDNTRSVINFYKAIIYPSDDELEIDIALKNKAGQSYEADTQIFVVVYGVAGTQSDVDVRLWDRYFYVDDKKIHFEAPIDMVNKDIENVNDLSINNGLNMNNRPIKNLGDGNENSDAVNVKQLNDLKTNVTNYVTGEFGKVNPVLSNNSDLIKFIYRNLIRNDSKLFLIKELYFPDSNQGRTQNSYTSIRQMVITKEMSLFI